MADVTDEELDVLASLAASMPWAARDAFLRLVTSQLAGYPPQARGVGLAHRLGVEAQRAFVNVATGAGGKYGRIRQPIRLADVIAMLCLKNDVGTVS